jgi:hypothetical protein
MCVFQVEVAEKRAFFRWKCLKNLCFWAEVAKNVRFSGGSG